MSYLVARKPRFIHSEELERLGYPEYSAFDTRRAARTKQILESMDMLDGDGREVVAPTPATREELEVFHTAAYLDVLLKGSAGEFDPRILDMGLGSQECPVFPEMYDYAALSCGASLLGAGLLLSGDADLVFQPSGGFHHAGPDYAAGFCYMNDVVLAIHRLAEARERVLYVDIDVHHGDGVQAAFYDRADVMTISVHESPKSLFPFTTGLETELGEGDGLGYNANVPLPVGTYDQAFRNVIRDVVLPLSHAFKPDVVVCELGMDALSGDPLAHLELTNGALVDGAKALLELDKPMLVTGGGGYHPENTARGWALAWAELTGQETHEDMALGLGGVMLGTSDWAAGLRDRVSWTDRAQQRRVNRDLEQTVHRLKTLLFPRFGLAL